MEECSNTLAFRLAFLALNSYFRYSLTPFSTSLVFTLPFLGFLLSVGLICLPC